MKNHNCFKVLCDTVALAYHEARNVRHLIREGFLPQEPWRFIISLPNNRADAWREIVPLRAQSEKAISVDAALQVFERNFHVSLRDLALMYANENWRHSKLCGGNAWAQITELAIDLADALQSENKMATKEIVAKVQSARHNTGFLNEKLASLDKASQES